MEPWRPNWLHNEPYELYRDLSWSELAWQFLRRNTKYQRDWEQWVADCATLGTDVRRSSPQSKKRAQPWSISDLVDPASDDFRERWLLSRFAKRLTNVRNKDNLEYLELECDKKRAYGFDLTKSITPQVKAVEEDLLEEQRALLRRGVSIKKSAKRTGDLPLYLRILDAKAAGVSHEVIVNSLDIYSILGASGPDRLKENLRSARHIVSKGYIDLAIRSENS